MIVPALVPGLYEATAVACGTAFTCARMADGWIRCWGANESGQIGDGTRLEREVPMPVRF
jgi:alpha-tubulin suppressor-like RCC1 family protein